MAPLSKNEQLDKLIELIFFLFIGAAVIQILHLLIFHSQFLFIKDAVVKESKLKVSLIIAARNELNNLQRFLPQIMKQKGVDYEVIVVDDCSLDGTQDFLRQFEVNHSNFKFTTIKENRKFEGGKKFALTMGIKSAKHENLVFIDADCYPSSEYWLAEMSSSLEKRNLVLGYGAYERKNSFLNFFIRFDTFLIALNYMSYAKLGIAYMGVGRNLAYKSFLFFDNKGFANHQDLRSGDDDLFVNEVSNKNNTIVKLNSQSITYSIPEKTWRDWVIQKKRHLSTAKRYRSIHKILLSILPLSLYLFYGSLFVLTLSDYDTGIVLIIFGIRFLLQQLVYGFGLRKTGELELFAVGVIFDVFYMIFYPLVVIVDVIEKCNEWKR